MPLSWLGVCFWLELGRFGAHVVCRLCPPSYLIPWLPSTVLECARLLELGSDACVLGCALARPFGPALAVGLPLCAASCCASPSESEGACACDFAFAFALLGACRSSANSFCSSPGFHVYGFGSRANLYFSPCCCLRRGPYGGPLVEALLLEPCWIVNGVVG